MFPRAETKNLLWGEKTFHEKLKIVSALEAISEDKKKEVCGFASNIFDYSHGVTSKSEVIKEVAFLNMYFGFSKEDWMNLIESGRIASCGLKDGKAVAMVYRAVAGLPKEKWLMIVKTKSLFKYQMSIEDRFILLTALQSLNHEPDVRFAEGLWKSEEIADILKAQDEVTASSDFGRKRILDAAKKGIYEHMSVAERIRWLDWEESSQWDCPLKDNVISHDQVIPLKRVVEKIVKEMSVIERYHFIEMAKSLLKRYGSLENQIAILNAIAKLPADNLSDIRDQYRALLGEREYESDQNKIDLLNAIAALPADSMSYICTQCRYLSNERMLVQDRIALLNAIAALPADEREDICTRYRHLENTNRNVQSAIALLNAIAAVPSRLRDQIPRLHSIRNVDELIQRMRALQDLPRPATIPAPAMNQSLSEGKKLWNLNEKFNRLGSIELAEIALVIAAKGVTSVYVIPEIRDLIQFINRLVENPTKNSIHRFQFVRRAGGHSFFGEVTIDKSNPQPRIKMFVCDPLGSHDVLLYGIANALSKDALSEFFVPKSEEKLQKGLGCSYFSLDGAFMLRNQEKYEDIYKLSEPAMPLTRKVHYISLPIRMKRACQYYDAIKPIIDSPQSVVVNKKGQLASESIKNDLKESVNMENETRILNMRVERKMKTYGRKVQRYLESNNITAKSQVEEIVRKHSIPGIQEYCDRQVINPRSK